MERSTSNAARTLEDAQEALQRARGAVLLQDTQGAEVHLTHAQESLLAIRHPASEDLEGILLALQYDGGAEPREIRDVADALDHQALLASRDAQYLHTVTLYPEQAGAGSNIEHVDHPHYVPDPWVLRGTAVEHIRTSTSERSTARWRDAAIALEREHRTGQPAGERAGSPRDAQAIDAVRVAHQGRVVQQTAVGRETAKDHGRARPSAAQPTGRSQSQHRDVER